MPEQIVQQDRMLKVYTPLDFDVLLIQSISGTEGISKPFQFTVKLVADVLTGQQSKVLPDKLVGKAMSVEMELPGGKKRYFNGLVESFTKESQDDQLAYYRAEVVSWLTFLDLKADCRIFQDQTALEIIQKVVTDTGYISYFRSDLIKEYTKWDYCVQYRETDLEFLSRLMESEGISYYFEHKDDRTHTLVLTDSPDGFHDCPNQSEFRFDPEVGIGEFEDVIRTWETSQELLSSKWTLRDYHFEMPRNTLEVPEPSVHATEDNKNLDVFDYPGGFAKKFNKPEQRLGKVRPEGEKLVRIHVEEDENSHIFYDGTSYCRAMLSGYKFTVKGGSQVPQGPYLLTAIHHHAIQHPAYKMELYSDIWYTNGFSSILASVQFRPECITPKPIVHGPQTARVIAENLESQEEIWPDKFGRVRVIFPWDRKAEYACWIRVAQPWAGNMWGHQWIPRVGDEVVVTFLEGDPDCPLIVGSVYNADNMPPFKLPDNKTQSGLLTHSSPKGNSENYNKFRFEDKKGQEDVLLHCEHTMHNSVEQTQYITVGLNRNITTGGVDKDGNDIGDVKEKVFRHHNLHVLNDCRTKIEGEEHITVLLDSLAEYAKDRSVNVDGDETVVAQNITFQAAQTITLIAGSNSIVLGPSGVTVLGVPMINLNPMGAMPPMPVVLEPPDPPADPDT
jgi:type VI secretion system secreted protein VgrG